MSKFKVGELVKMIEGVNSKKHENSYSSSNRTLRFLPKMEEVKRLVATVSKIHIEYPNLIHITVEELEQNLWYHEDWFERIEEGFLEEELFLV